MAKVDPMDIDSMWAGEEDEDKKYDKPSYTGSRGGGLYKKSLKSLEKERERNKIRKEYPSLTDELADELIEKRKRNKGMLEWSEDLQRAVMTDELKKAHPEYTDEQIAEKVDYELGGTEMEIEDESSMQPKYSFEELKKMYPDISDKSLEELRTKSHNEWSDTTRNEWYAHALRQEYPNWSEDKIQEEVHKYDNEELVPEMETEVVDLPPEDENEKEIVVNRNPDSTITEDVEETSEDPLKDFDPNSVADPEEEYETRVSAKEVGDDPTRYPTDEEIEGIEEEQPEDKTVTEPSKDDTKGKANKPTKEEKAMQEALEEAQAMAQDNLEGFKVPKNWKTWTEKQKSNAINAYMKNRENQSVEEPKEEPETPVMSDEDALKEAQELAQDDLLGFKISGANWEKMSEKQKAEAIKAFKDANKKEDHSTNIDKSETNNYSSYERYPTGLKVTEDALGEVNTIAGGIKDAAHKIGQEGTSSGSISNEVARAVPHYDYRSLFR